jgi:excisionase family DNA binding protein
MSIPAREIRLEGVTFASDDVEPLITAVEVAAMLNVTATHVRALAKNNRIPHYRIGGSVRFRKSKVWQWLQNHEK